MKTRLFIQHGVGNMIKREISVQYQKHTLQKVYLCQIRVIAYSVVGLLNQKSEVFKFLLLLCEGMYFVFLCVVCNDTQNRDAAGEPLPMGNICPRRTFKQEEAQQIPEGLSVCTGVVGLGFVLQFATSSPPLKP